MIVIFKDNEFVKLSDNQDEIDKYRIDSQYMLYEIDFDLSIDEYIYYDWLLDINNNVKWFLKNKCVDTYKIEIKKCRVQYWEYVEKVKEYEQLSKNIQFASFWQRVKYLFTGEI